MFDRVLNMSLRIFFARSNKKDTTSKRQIDAVLKQFTYLYLVIKGTITLQM